MGRAEGIAIGFGAPDVTREHVLIAYLWARFRLPQHLVRRRARGVLEHLGARGVQIPVQALPPLPPPSGHRIFIPYDESDAIISELLTRLPAGSGFGCNHDGKSRAWVVARADVDLSAYVAEVLDDLGLESIPQQDDA